MKNHKYPTVMIAGGTGLVGQHLANLLVQKEYHVIVLSRNPVKSTSENLQYVRWDINKDFIDEVPYPDHIINLAGEGIADERWTLKRKTQLIESRVLSAKTIQNYIAKNKLNPSSYISASAIGYYGDRKEEILDENASPGSGFLSECAQQWENAALKTGESCQRSVILRIGIVLSMRGGALPKMMMTSGFGLYNYFGDGKQIYSWIHIDDLCKMILFSIENQHVNGIYNAVAPEPVTNYQLMAAIKKLKKGILISAPAFALRMVLGEMSSVVLDSVRARCDKIVKAGFRFHFMDISTAIQSLLIGKKLSLKCNKK